MKKVLLVAAVLLLCPWSAAAQFPQASQQAGSSSSNPGLVVGTTPAPPVAARPGGPLAIGAVMPQQDPETGKVVVLQAPPVAEKPASGGVIQLSAFGWLQPYVDTLAQLLIAAVVAWFGRSKYGQMMDDTSRAALETFLKNRASSLIADGAVKIQGKAIHVDNKLLFRAASEASTAIPQALKRFGLTPEVVSQKIIDAIPQTPAGAAIVADAHKDVAEPEAVTDRPPAAPAPKKVAAADGSVWPPV